MQENKDYISIFNSMLGLQNLELNSSQKERQERIERKIDDIISRLDRIERRMSENDKL